MIYNLFFDSLNLLFDDVVLTNWQTLTLQILSTILTIALYLLFLIVPIFAVKLFTSIFFDREGYESRRKKRRH